MDLVHHRIVRSRDRDSSSDNLIVKQDLEQSPKIGICQDHSKQGFEEVSIMGLELSILGIRKIKNEE